MLRDRDIDTVVLAGTTTPNCIRTTCYDALSLGYNVVVLEDATSSRTPAVQKANIDDMAYIGTTIMSCDEFAAVTPPSHFAEALQALDGSITYRSYSVAKAYP